MLNSQTLNFKMKNSYVKSKNGDPDDVENPLLGFTDVMRMKIEEDHHENDQTQPEQKQSTEDEHKEEENKKEENKKEQPKEEQTKEEQTKEQETYDQEDKEHNEEGQSPKARKTSIKDDDPLLDDGSTLSISSYRAIVMAIPFLVDFFDVDWPTSFHISKGFTKMLKIKKLTLKLKFKFKFKIRITKNSPAKKIKRGASRNRN